VAVELAVLGPEPDARQIAAADAIAGLSINTTLLPLDWTARSEAELDRTVHELKRLARQSGADIVHLNGPALAGRSRWTVPLVTTIHSCVGTWWCAVQAGPMPADFVWRTRRASDGMAVAGRVIAPSRSFADAVEVLYGAGFAVEPIHNGTAALNAPSVPKDHFVFTAGRLWDEGKNVALLDRAARRMSWPVYAAGPVEGPNGPRCAFDSLRMLGTLSRGELAVWYAAAPIFVSPSKYEPFGLTVLEAAQAGAALVLSDIATFRELWDGAALFVPADDSEALAEAIEALAGDPGRLNDLGRRACARGKAYTVENMVDGTLEVYASVLSESRFAEAV
jgi:glycosyltransferase involved in cell wall biosynthesis